MVKALRIDNSFDANIITDWCSELNLTNIIIANDAIANDEILSTIIKLSMPHNLKVAIKDVDVAGELLKDKLCEQINILVIVKNLRDAMYIINSSGCITHVNISNPDQLFGGNGISNMKEEQSAEYEILHEIARRMPESICQTSITDQAILLNDLLR